MAPLPIKRRRPPSTTSEADLKILELIKSSEKNGVSRPQINFGTKLPTKTITDSLKKLINENLIKEFTNINNKRSKHYMGVEFQPSDEVTGGEWYTNEGNIDTEVISTLREICMKVINKLRIATIEDISNFILKSGIFKDGISTSQLKQIMTTLVLDGEVDEVMSNGYGDFSSVPFGKVCYRKTKAKADERKAKGKGDGAMSSIPCGVCPRIKECSPDEDIKCIERRQHWFLQVLQQIILAEEFEQSPTMFPPRKVKGRRGGMDRYLPPANAAAFCGYIMKINNFFVHKVGRKENERDSSAVVCFVAIFWAITGT